MAVSAIAALFARGEKDVHLTRRRAASEVSRASLIKLVGHTRHRRDDRDDAASLALRFEQTLRATFRIRSGLPTEVPPYFWTIRRMGGSAQR